MKNLTTNQAKDIILWYAIEGQKNWGSWGNYPSLPINANYHSFETCSVRILLEEKVTYGSLIFNCLSTSNIHKTPGKNLIRISFGALKNELIKNGVTFINDSYVTEEYSALRKQIDILDKSETVTLFKKMATYEWCYDKVLTRLNEELNNVVINKIAGNPIPKSIVGHELTLTNYCEKETYKITVDLELIEINSRKTAGRYKVISTVDKNKICTLFANEKLESYKMNLNYHEAKLAEVL